MNIVDRLSDECFVIFLFHGVTDSSDYEIRNYTRKHLDKEYFYRIILSLNENGNPISMDDVVAYKMSGKSCPPRSFVVTFDDGFENNFSIAAPIMEELCIPATFYITTGFIEYNHMSWTDRIEYCLENCSNGYLYLPWVEDKQPFHDKNDKIRLLDSIRKHVKNSNSFNIDKLVSDIFIQCGIREIEQSNDPLDQKMSWDQVRELHRKELFTVGGHSHYHANMALLDKQQLEDDISTSISLMKERAGIDVRHYAYPEGLENHYSDAVIEKLKAHNIICSPTAIDGINDCTTDLFNLKRVMVV